MSTHESLAAGLIGSAGALFAAWVAFLILQKQIEREDSQRELSYDAAKLAAILAITQSVHAAASALLAVNRAITAYKASASYDSRNVDLSFGYVANALDSFVVREAMKDLRANDRAPYIMICTTLATLVNIHKKPGVTVTVFEHLINQQKGLMNIRTYLRSFDTELADAFDRDAEIKSASLPSESADHRS